MIQRLVLRQEWALGRSVTRLAYDSVADILYGVYDNPGRPKLATIDVCSGAATPIGSLVMPGNFVDCFDFDATGQGYVCVSDDGIFPADGTAETLGRLDVTTLIVNADVTFTDMTDGDEIVLGLPTPLLIDGDSVGNQHFFYDLDLSTGTLSNIRTGDPRSARQGVHEGVLYGLGASGAIAGQIVTHDIATAVATPVGGSYTLGNFIGLKSGRGCRL